MSETNHAEKTFVAYEYTTVQVRYDELQQYKDCYRSFGWIMVEQSDSLTGTVALKMKRDRSLKGNGDLNQLQRQAEAALSTIGKLEKGKAHRATIVALCVALLGTAFMAGAVFAVTAENILLCVVLGIPGFIGWGAAYALYRKVEHDQTVRTTPLIDQQYEELSQVCQQANVLLA